VFSIAAELGVWLALTFTPAGAEFPAQLAGVLASLAGMLIGSHMPQGIRDQKSPHHGFPHLG